MHYSSILSRMLEGSNLSRAQAARLIGTTWNAINRAANENDQYGIRMELLPKVTEVLGLDLIRTIAQDCGGMFVSLPEVDPTTVEGAVLIRLYREFAQAADSITDSLKTESESGEDISKPEARRIKREVRDVMEICLQVQAYCDAVITGEVDQDL